MPITVVAGGQFGSEGKGKVAHWIAAEQRATVAVRAGGPNSGHTVISGERELKFRMLPTSSILEDVDAVLPAGSIVSVPILLQEIEDSGLDPLRVHVDPNAMVLADSDVRRERQDAVLSGIGSTQSGTGAAVMRRIAREARTLASDCPDLKPFLSDTRRMLRVRLERNERVILEGTQGFGLSVYHSSSYPYVTSRDTTAAGFLSEVGLSPLDVDDVVLVLRAFPIRVAGDSGPLPNEVEWDDVGRLGGFDKPLGEYTTVTEKLRRVALFDPEVANEAIIANRPTKVVVNHLDYFDRAAHESKLLNSVVARALGEIAQSLTSPVTHVGLGADHLLAL